MNVFDTKIADIDHRIKKMVTKEQLNDLCTVQEVETIIQDNLANFEPSFPIIEDAEGSGEEIATSFSPVKPQSPPTVAKKQQQQSKKESGSASEKDSGVEESKPSKLPKAVESIQQQQVLKRRDSRESRTRIAYQEVSAKMLYLEQEIAKAKGHVTSLEVLLDDKIEMSAIDGKLDKDEVCTMLLEKKESFKWYLAEYIILAYDIYSYV